ncbi:MAG: hypothetical protein COT92_01280 [Candidatus Doudnabacteria bacterium CG10_big_fil_rev_8_21_14_0_10_42_18]|uniref:Uncharacterized protein n=1 Tax=Candidatus Doudnabacteria bacterium CG10_big_fil_rev_8_21_14_0_10_42_18 TaxID=1974552 RepID=A0A2H0VBC6_9BACT|nr:MAG: hypothetical protein COT92_01280 [Candidatus Doudnabacteria bacterium CG10_big_fil_rev_8_21_14_0_10_42_18]
MKHIARQYAGSTPLTAASPFPFRVKRNAIEESLILISKDGQGISPLPRPLCQRAGSVEMKDNLR